MEIYFIEWTPLVIFSRVSKPRVKILPMVFTRWNKCPSFTEKTKYSVYFMLLTLSWEKLYQNPVQFFSVILCGVPLPHSNTLQYYVKREKCKVNDVIFPSGCEARAINLGNKTVKIGIFTGGTSVREKNIFIHIYRYPTGKHKIKQVSLSWARLVFFWHAENLPLTKKLWSSQPKQTADWHGSVLFSGALSSPIFT